MQDFKNAALKQLTDQQMRFAPAARRREQVLRAEKLLADIEAGRSYPYSFVCFRLTDFRPVEHGEMPISGEELAHDLVLFIRKLEKSIPPLPIEQAVEPMLSLEEVSKLLKVSTKTISRWRVHGLVGIRILRNGRRQLGFPKSIVDRFLQGHAEQVERGAKFSHLTEEEKDDILRRARRLASAGGCLSDVSRRIARRLGRSVEAVRYTIRNFDRDHPEAALFPSVTGPLAGDQKPAIYNSYRKGTPVETLAKKYGRTRSSIYRVINEVRAERLVQEPLDYIYHESFDDPAKIEEILAEMPGEEDFLNACRTARVPKDVPPELASLYEWPLLTREQEAHLFRKMNYLKHALHKLRERIDPAAARVQDLKAIEELQSGINAVKNRLINCNMRLVVSIAKKHSGQTENLFELISDGNVSLLRAVEKFDFSRGNKFSTYASWAIMKNFARSIPDEKTHRDRFMTGNEDVFAARQDSRSDEGDMLAQAEQAREKVNRLLEELDPRTREVIRRRAGLDGHQEETLEQIGQGLGITKERVRQIAVRGMKQLRERAEADHIDLS